MTETFKGWVNQMPPPAGPNSQTITVVVHKGDGTEETVQLTWDESRQEYV